MLFSRQIAKRRIAAKTRPGFLAAWGLVLLDGASILGVLAALFGPVTAFLTQSVSGGAFYALMFVIFFLPLQAVLIISAIWAVFSRWQDKEPEI